MAIGSERIFFMEEQLLTEILVHLKFRNNNFYSLKSGYEKVKEKIVFGLKGRQSDLGNFISCFLEVKAKVK